MVFIALGTHGRPINRVIDWAVETVNDGSIPGPVIVQCAVQGARTDVDWRPILSEPHFFELMRSAEVLVTHGGPGTIVGALSLGRVPIVVPRERRFGEHVDDHQVEFSALLGKLGLPVARNVLEFREAIKRVRAADPRIILQDVSTGMEPLRDLFSDVRNRFLARVNSPRRRHRE